MNTTEQDQFNIDWICDQIREKCGEEILHLSYLLESSVTEYYYNCDADMSLGDVVENYLADNPEKEL
jgi:hypothetical protein